MEIPTEFLCPITNQLMNDPVTCDDGYTYDNHSIKELCHSISPKTFEPIKTMTSNRNIKSAIDRYKKESTKTETEYEYYMNKKKGLNEELILITDEIELIKAKIESINFE